VAPVGELTAVIGGIDLTPEGVQQLLVRDPLGIVHHLDHLNMASGPIIFIRRVGRAAAGITRLNREHTIEFFKRRFHAPETAAGKQGALLHVIALPLLLILGCTSCLIIRHKDHTGRQKNN
jgi:hypothetical protein